MHCCSRWPARCASSAVLDALLARLLDGIAGQGHAACAALAPTPRAALWLATAVETGGCECRAACARPDLRDALAMLPLDVLELDAGSGALPAGFGARSLGDLLRLPQRSGPSPRCRFLPPWSRRRSAKCPTCANASVSQKPSVNRSNSGPRRGCCAPPFAAQRLVQVLCGWFAARQRCFHLPAALLEHERAAPLCSNWLFAAPTRDPERIGRVLRERLERLSLAAPVETAIVLFAEGPRALPGRAGGLFGDTAAGEGVMLLVERLQARLGEASVHAVAVRPEHRPERASAMLPWPGSNGCLSRPASLLVAAAAAAASRGWRPAAA